MKQVPVTIKQPQIERGAASILIELKDGKICIKHGSEDSILFEPTTVTAGTWQRLFAAIKSEIIANEYP